MFTDPILVFILIQFWFLQQRLETQGSKPKFHKKLSWISIPIRLDLSHKARKFDPVMVEPEIGICPLSVERVSG